MPPHPSPDDDRPILFVGDIQGCARELALLLERAGYQPGVHRLLPVGDTINRGPDSLETLRILRDCAAECILGNHELGLLEVLRTGTVPDWERVPHAAYTQLQAAGCWESTMAEIAQWPLLRTGPDWIAVHAGLHPRLPPERTPADFLTEVRWCDAEGTRPDGVSKDIEGDPPGFPPWYAHYRGERTVVFGHWAQRGLIHAPRVRGLDTGCVYGGRLTGLWWPEDRRVQVDALAAYRPVNGPVHRRLD